MTNNTTASYIDFFLELEADADEGIGFRELIPESYRNRYWAWLPERGAMLPNGSKFYMARIPERDYNDIKDVAFFRERIVGYTWNELWERPYCFRDYAFQVSVSRPFPTPEGGRMMSQIRVSIADIDPDENVVDGKAYPLGIFLGDEAPEFEFQTRLPTLKRDDNTRAGIRNAVSSVIDLVTRSNELSVSEKTDICGYLRACNNILEMDNVDRSVLGKLLEKARFYAERIGSRAIEAGIREIIERILDNLPL